MADANGVSGRSGGRRYARLVVAAILIVTAAGLVAARALDPSRAAREELGKAAAQLSVAEPAVLAIDQAVRSEVTTAVVEGATAALERIGTARATLIGAQGLVDRARRRLAKRDRPLADALDEAIAARLEMLERARPVLEADLSVAAALEPATRAWSLIAEAEKAADDAVAQFNKHTKAGVEASTRMATHADGLLAEARSLLETVAAGVPEAEMAPFIAYIDAKRALLSESRKIDATWLAGKVAEANAMLQAYNAKDKQVAEQAKKLPGSPASQLASAYKLIVQDDIEAYFEARERARAADVKVRSLWRQ